MSIAGLLFDLDGTLVDTAPDLVAVLNVLLEEAGRPPMPYAIARNEVSNGAIGLIRLGFGLPTQADVPAGSFQRFLEIYSRNLCINSSLFIELEYINDIVSEMQLRWGIVTNKPAFLTLPLLERLGLGGATPCVVSGDTLPQRKPHPAPLEHGARLLELDPSQCVYVGDALRDIEAGRAAAMRTIAATWGYIRAVEDPRAWQADAVVEHPRSVRGILLHLSAAAR